MAYNNNEDRLEVASIQKNNRGDILKVAQITSSSGARSIDARMYYTSDSGEVLPTKKGIRVSDEMAGDVVLAMFKAMSTEARMDVFGAIEGIYNQTLCEEEAEDADDDIEDEDFEE
jgi:hypothetical protein